MASIIDSMRSTKRQQQPPRNQGGGQPNQPEIPPGLGIGLSGGMRQPPPQSFNSNAGGWRQSPSGGSPGSRFLNWYQGGGQNYMNSLQGMASSGINGLRTPGMSAYGGMSNPIYQDYMNRAQAINDRAQAINNYSGFIGINYNPERDMRKLQDEWNRTGQYEAGMMGIANQMSQPQHGGPEISMPQSPYQDMLYQHMAGMSQQPSLYDFMGNSPNLNFPGAGGMGGWQGGQGGPSNIGMMAPWMQGGQPGGQQGGQIGFDHNGQTYQPYEPINTGRGQAYFDTQGNYQLGMPPAGGQQGGQPGGYDPQTATPLLHDTSNSRGGQQGYQPMAGMSPGDVPRNIGMMMGMRPGGGQPMAGMSPGYGGQPNTGMNQRVNSPFGQTPSATPGGGQQAWGATPGDGGGSAPYQDPRIFEQIWGANNQPYNSPVSRPDIQNQNFNVDLPSMSFGANYDNLRSSMPQVGVSDTAGDATSAQMEMLQRMATDSGQIDPTTRDALLAPAQQAADRAVSQTKEGLMQHMGAGNLIFSGGAWDNAARGMTDVAARPMVEANADLAQQQLEQQNQNRLAAMQGYGDVASREGQFGLEAGRTNTQNLLTERQQQLDNTLQGQQMQADYNKAGAGLQQRSQENRAQFNLDKAGTYLKAEEVMQNGQLTARGQDIERDLTTAGLDVKNYLGEGGLDVNRMELDLMDKWKENEQKMFGRELGLKERMQMLDEWKASKGLQVDVWERQQQMGQNMARLYQDALRGDRDAGIKLTGLQAESYLTQRGINSQEARWAGQILSNVLMNREQMDHEEKMLMMELDAQSGGGFMDFVGSIVGGAAGVFTGGVASGAAGALTGKLF